jgi:hypothetical protein
VVASEWLEVNGWRGVGGWWKMSGVEGSEWMVEDEGRDKRREQKEKKMQAYIYFGEPISL